MKITDCPYPVGTEEHSHWVNTVLIPAQSQDEVLLAEHDARAGAISIGKNLIIGEDELDKALREYVEKINDAFIKSIKAMSDSFSAYSIEVEKFGIQGIFLDKGEIQYSLEETHQQHKDHQKKIKQLCIPHGKPKGSCRKCHKHA